MASFLHWLNHMNKIDTVGLFAELFTKDGFCHLNHGPDTSDVQVVAVDYLVIPLGKIGDIEIHEPKAELTIPICEQCLDGLTDPEWLLLICLNCLSSQWIYKKEAKLSYINKEQMTQYKIIILNGCPKCTNKFNGIWFML